MQPVLWLAALTARPSERKGNAPMTRTLVKIGMAACALSAANACAFLGTPAGGATRTDDSSARNEGAASGGASASALERFWREADRASRLGGN